MKEINYPLERSPAVKIMGVLITGSVSGQILVGILLLIGIYFMGSQGFTPISIIFFMIFLVPVAITLHLRLVNKGKKLMEPWTEIHYYDESNTVSYKTGFPNTMNPDWHELKITEENKDVKIKGSDVLGYFIQLEHPPKEKKRLKMDDKVEDARNMKKEPEPVRLGLWLDLDDAIENGQELADLTGGDLVIKVSKNEEMSDTES